MKNKTPCWNYLPVEKSALEWGIHVIDAGSNSIPANAVYPPQRHPEEYLFSWNEGRIFNEYQVVYITKGRGIFETSEIGQIRVEAGHVFLLFPEVWHRFRPLRTKGWDENWIGFSGEVAHRIMRRFFNPQKPVMRIGFDQEFLSLMRSLPVLIEEAPPGFQELMAARTMEVLALLRSRAMGHKSVDREVVRKVQKARYYLLEHSAEEIDMPALSKRLGVSYSRFRAMFKEHTGTAPHQYQIDIRINKALDLLQHSTLTISEIADRLGFTSAYYFSRLFKKKHGCSPSAFRSCNPTGHCVMQAQSDGKE